MEISSGDSENFPEISVNFKYSGVGKLGVFTVTYRATKDSYHNHISFGKATNMIKLKILKFKTFSHFELTNLTFRTSNMKTNATENSFIVIYTDYHINFR